MTAAGDALAGGISLRRAMHFGSGGNHQPAQVIHVLGHESNNRGSHPGRIHRHNQFAGNEASERGIDFAQRFGCRLGRWRFGVKADRQSFGWRLFDRRFLAAWRLRSGMVLWRGQMQWRNISLYGLHGLGCTGRLRWRVRAAATALGCLNPATSANMTTPATQNAAIFPVGLFTKLTASRAFMAGLIWVERAVVRAARWFPSVLPERR